MKKHFGWLLVGFLSLVGCQTFEITPAPPLATATTIPANTATQLLITVPATPTLATFATPTPSQSKAMGPEIQDFPEGINPLTGLRVQYTENLQIPAALISISNSPITARPQAGLSFAANVVELFIGEGTTRFLAFFYGEMPRRLPVISDKLLSEEEVLARNDLPMVFSGRVWLDSNADGIQDPWEAGLGGVPIMLFKQNGEVEIARQKSDNLGYFSFDASDFQAGVDYILKFDTKEMNISTEPKVRIMYGGLPVNGVDLPVQQAVGKNPIAASDIAPSRTYVGPIRSGRLTYDDFNRMFPGSCLVFASAGDGILERLNPCLINYGAEDSSSPNTSLLDVDNMVALAKENRSANMPVNYSGNLFSTEVPKGGSPALVLDDYFHQFAQSRWVYDPLSKSYLRYTDSIDGTGIFHADSDRLTGRQISFENVIMLLANYSVFRHGQYDVDLCCGLEGYAYLFRDGQVYRIRWNTNNREWEQTTGTLRPIKFLGEDKQPIALRPGRTWIALMTTNSSIYELEPGKWKAEFAMPNDVAPEE